MAETVEELLQENVAKIQSFHDVLEKLKVEMDDLPTDSEFEDAKKDYQSAVDEMFAASNALGVVESAFERSEQEIEGKLKQLEDLADAIETKAVATDKETDDIFAQLDTGINGLDYTMRNLIQPGIGKLLTLKENAEGLDTLVKQKEKDLETSANSYVAKADEAFINLENRRTTTISALDTFTSKGGQMIDEGKTAMEAALTHIQQEYDQIHSDFADKIKGQIERAAAEEESQVKQQLQQSVDDAKQQVQDANKKVQDAKQAIEDEAAEVEKQADQAAETIDEADTALDKVKSSIK